MAELGRLATYLVLLPKVYRYASKSCSVVVGYLVDPASSHMLVSKTKPCMCKYKRLNRETANGSLNQL